MTVLLNPKMSEIDHWFLQALFEYLNHGLVFIRQRFIFFQISFWGEVVSSQIEETSEK